MYVYRFQREWLELVAGKCGIKSVDKSVRIVCDYYMSRVEQARNEEGEEAAGKVEKEIFTKRRVHDSRVAVAEERRKGRTEEVAVQILDEETQADVGACTAEETFRAIKSCQVGRGSAFFAEALMETAEETAARRKEEVEKENTEEMREARRTICKALGGVMG